MIIRRRKNILLIIFFVLLLILPALDSIFCFSPVKNLAEKRSPISLPQSPKTIKQIIVYPKNFEDFYNDNYGFRKTFIFANGKIMDNVFNESPSSRVFIGKDGWLYFDNQNSLLDAQGLVKIDEKKLTIMAQSLIKNWKKLKTQNIDYALVIAADKTSIYPEFLPEFIKIYSNQSRADRLILVLKKIAPDFPVIDLRPILKEAKNHEQIYHKTDTHWNLRGAYVGYNEIAKKINLNPMLRQDFIEVEEVLNDGDISGIMGLELSEINYTLQKKFPLDFYEYDIKKEKPKVFHKPKAYFNYNKNLPILFVYKDSFFDNMMMFFSHHFSRNYFINEFPCDLDMKIMKKYHPNVVIQEFWEGRVEEVMNKCQENL